MMKYILLYIMIVLSPVSFAKTQSIPQIEKKILELHKDINSKNLKVISRAISNTSKKYNIDSKIIITLLMQESTFSQNKISESGDISIAQVNYKIWEKEFSRRKLGKLNKNLLKTDIAYSIDVMGKILNIIKEKYGKREKYWFTRYHSNTIKRRIAYTNLLAQHSSFNEINP